MANDTHEDDNEQGWQPEMIPLSPLFETIYSAVYSGASPHQVSRHVTRLQEAVLRNEILAELYPRASVDQEKRAALNDQIQAAFATSNYEPL